jgi:hypothetical protein
MQYFEKGVDFISSWDLFGKKIDLNYKRKGSEYKTFAGGIISILI